MCTFSFVVSKNMTILKKKKIISKCPCCTHRRSSKADIGALWAPGVSWHCPTAAAHTPAYCPETEMSVAAKGEKQRGEHFHASSVQPAFSKQLLGWNHRTRNLRYTNMRHIFIKSWRTHSELVSKSINSMNKCQVPALHCCSVQMWEWVQAECWAGLNGENTTPGSRRWWGADWGTYEYRLPER